MLRFISWLLCPNTKSLHAHNGRRWQGGSRLPVLINGLPALPFFCRPLCLEAQQRCNRNNQERLFYDYVYCSFTLSRSVHATPVSSGDGLH
ncbi:hypothetical protein J3U68_00950 [Snodgrassella sp. B3882]|uniref:hypothetical protein n=1 Tax=Snodgrassella sp. B3882 TaxID=2818037 RepID=UPI00226A09D4|nr:hypothetical protein [Snodgrassella sp. B3882]MCX8743981.1 hypothetical protein [Snodgrassella sp. B3882]